jgi:hypothetical protein
VGETTSKAKCLQGALVIENNVANLTTVILSEVRLVVESRAQGLGTRVGAAQQRHSVARSGIPAWRHRTGRRHPSSPSLPDSPADSVLLHIYYYYSGRSIQISKKLGSLGFKTNKQKKYIFTEFVLCDRPLR